MSRRVEHPGRKRFGKLDQEIVQVIPRGTGSIELLGHPELPAFQLADPLLPQSKLFAV